MLWDDAVHGVIVLVGCGREGRQVGQSGQRRWDTDGVAFCWRVILALSLIDEGNLCL